MYNTPQDKKKQFKQKSMWNLFVNCIVACQTPAIFINSLITDTVDDVVMHCSAVVLSCLSVV